MIKKDLEALYSILGNSSEVKKIKEEASTFTNSMGKLCNILEKYFSDYNNEEKIIMFKVDSFSVLPWHLTFYKKKFLFEQAHVGIVGPIEKCDYKPSSGIAIMIAPNSGLGSMRTTKPSIRNCKAKSDPALRFWIAHGDNSKMFFNGMWNHPSPASDPQIRNALDSQSFLITAGCKIATSPLLQQCKWIELVGSHCAGILAPCIDFLPDWVPSLYEDLVRPLQAGKNPLDTLNDFYKVGNGTTAKNKSFENWRLGVMPLWNAEILNRSISKFRSFKPIAVITTPKMKRNITTKSEKSRCVKEACEEKSKKGKIEKGSNFNWANLKGENLGGKNLEKIKLYKANLNSTKLIGTNLTKAILDNASMIEADLTDSILAGASCYKVNFDKAVIKNSILDNAYMRKVSNLTLKQLCSCKSIKNIKQLPFDLMRKMKEQNPTLVKWWKDPGEKGEKLMEEIENALRNRDNLLLYLFRVDIKNPSQVIALNQEVLFEQLQKKFREHLFLFSESIAVRVVKLNEEWDIVDRQNIWTVKSEKQVLNVYSNIRKEFQQKLLSMFSIENASDGPEEVYELYHRIESHTFLWE